MIKSCVIILILLAAFYESRGQAVDTDLVVNASGGRVTRVSPRRGDTNLIFELDPFGFAEAPADPLRSANLVEVGAWSESVSDGHGNNLRARLVVYDGTHTTNTFGHTIWNTASVCLEIQNLADANGHSTRLYFDMLGGLIFDLRDASGAPGANLAHPAKRGQVPAPYWVSLPPRAIMRLRATAGGISEGKDGDLRLFFLDLKSPTYPSWVLPAGDTNTWFLSAKLLPPPPPTNSTASNSNVWQVPLSVPAAKLSVIKLRP